MKHRSRLLLRSGALVSGLLLCSQAFAAFPDVPATHPNATAIEYVQSQGIVAGYPDGTFRPDSTINRAEFVKILGTTHRQWIDAEQAKQPGGPFWEDSMCIAVFSGTDISFPYTDVRKTDWFATTVCLVASQGLIDGYPDGTFRPANTINFVEAAKIIANQHLVTTEHDPLPTDSTPWYKPYVDVLADAHAIPLSIRSFDQKITRGEMAEMIWRLRTNNTTIPSKSYEDLEKTTMQWKPYRNDVYGFSVQLPPDWTINENQAASVFFLKNFDNGSSCHLSFNAISGRKTIDELYAYMSQYYMWNWLNASEETMINGYPATRVDTQQFGSDFWVFGGPGNLSFLLSEETKAAGDHYDDPDQQATMSTCPDVFRRIISSVQFTNISIH